MEVINKKLLGIVEGTVEKTNSGLILAKNTENIDRDKLTKVKVVLKPSDIDVVKEGDYVWIPSVKMMECKSAAHMDEEVQEIGGVRTVISNSKLVFFNFDDIWAIGDAVHLDINGNYVE